MLIHDTEEVCFKLGRRYQVEPSDLISYCLSRSMPLFQRIDQEQPEHIIRRYIKKSMRGYAMHYLRDGLTLIRVPRSLAKDYHFVPLLEHDQDWDSFQEDVVDNRLGPNFALFLEYLGTLQRVYSWVYLCS